MPKTSPGESTTVSTTSAQPLWEKPGLNPLTKLALPLFGSGVMVGQMVALEPNLPLLQAEAFSKKADYYLRSGGLVTNRLEAIQKDFIKNLQIQEPRIVAFEDVRQMASELDALGGHTPGTKIGAQRLVQELQAGVRPIDGYLHLLCEAAISHSGYQP